MGRRTCVGSGSTRSISWGSLLPITLLVPLNLATPRKDLAACSHTFLNTVAVESLDQRWKRPRCLHTSRILQVHLLPQSIRDRAVPTRPREKNAWLPHLTRLRPSWRKYILYHL